MSGVGPSPRLEKGMRCMVNSAKARSPQHEHVHNVPLSPFPLPPPPPSPSTHPHRWLSVFSFCAIISVVALVVVGGPIYSNEERATPGHDPGLDASVVWWNWSGSVAQLGSIVFALSCAPAALHAYTSMAPRSTR